MLFDQKNVILKSLITKEILHKTCLSIVIIVLASDTAPLGYQAISFYRQYNN